MDPSQIGFHLFRGENSKDVSKITNKYQEYQVGCMFFNQNLIVFIEFQAFISQNFVSIGFVLFPIIQKMVDHES